MEKLKLKYNMSDLWQAHNQGVGAGVRTPFHPRPAAKRAKGQLSFALERKYSSMQ